MSAVWIAGLTCALAWGVAAFGSPYPWAYGPLLIGCATLGVIGLGVGRRPLPRALVGSFMLIGLAIGVQLIPLPHDSIAAISPNALVIHQQYSLTALEKPLTFSIDAERTRLGLVFFCAFATLLFGAVRMLSRDGVRRLVVLITALGVVVAMAGIIQRATFNGKIYGFWELSQGGSPFGPFVNRNHFAGWMLLTLPLTIGYLGALVDRGMHEVSGWRNRLLWFSTPEANRVMLVSFAVLVMSLSMVLTLSRSGTLALLGAFFLSAVIMGRRQSSFGRRMATRVFLLAVSVIVVVWVGLDTLASRFIAQTPEMAISGRPMIWADAIRIVKLFPLTGTGLNTFGISTLFYQDSQPGEHLREAHNDYLQLAAEGGVLLGTPILITFLVLGGMIRKRLSTDVGSTWWIRMGAVTALLAIGAQSLVEFSLQIPANAALFCAVCAVALHTRDGV